MSEPEARPVPSDGSIDGGPALLREGYEFMRRRFDRLETDVFETRILLHPVVCMRGAEAARRFYDERFFVRDGAAPRRMVKTLFGRGGVQGLDGAAHHARKAMFLRMMEDGAMAELVDRFEAAWREDLASWTGRDQVVLLDAAHQVLCRAVCDWAGVPLPEDQVRHRTGQLTRLVDTSVAGPRYWRARVARRRANRWIRDVVRDIREGRLRPPPDRPAGIVAGYREPDGALLEDQVAAVELLNVLRPTVAIGRYLAFTAMALQAHPEERRRLSGDDRLLEPFVQEVRRLYPFFPFVAARVGNEFHWRGFHFPEGRRVALDIYGTNRDPRLWEDPDVFRPERFRHREPTAYDLVPQGGGDHLLGHRCAGEWITIAIMKRGARLLTEAMTWEVPADQPTDVDTSRMAALPPDGFVIRNVRIQGRPPS